MVGLCLLLLLAFTLAFVLGLFLGTCALVQCIQVYVALHLQSGVGLLGDIQTEHTVLQSACHLTVGDDLWGVVLGFLWLCLGLLLHRSFRCGCHGFLFLFRCIQVYMSHHLQCILSLLCLNLGLSLGFSLGFRFSLGFSLGGSFLPFLSLLFLLLLLEHDIGGGLQCTVGLEFL